jgi:hypothetical protein
VSLDKRAAERWPPAFGSAGLVQETPSNQGFSECRRGDLNSYSTGNGAVIVGPELWLQAA